MDALMAALVAALLTMIADRAALAAASTARPRRIIATTLLVTTILAAVSTAFGLGLAPRLASSTKTMLLAVAILLAGGELLLRRLPTVPPRSAAIALAGSGLWFIVVALATRSALPWLAVPGAVLGSTVAIAAAASFAPSWRALPINTIRRAIGALFVAVAAILASNAMGIA